MSLAETETTYFLSLVSEQPKTAKSCPSREYLRGPPGEGRQWRRGTRQLWAGPSESHWLTRCLCAT